MDYTNLTRFLENPEGQQQEIWTRVFQEDGTNTVAEICVKAHGWFATNRQLHLEAGSFMALCAMPSCEQTCACPACCTVSTA